MPLQLNRARALGKAAVALLALAALAVWAAAPAAAHARLFAPLADHLRSAGAEPAQVERLLASPELEFEGRLLSRLLARSESSLNYQQFLQKPTVARARAFQREHARLLAATEAATGVPSEVVVAILAVESNLGSYSGRWRTFNVLASQAVLDTPAGRRALKAHWPKSQAAYFRSQKLRERLQWRASWAREELVALLKLARRENVSPLWFRGSPAGALGMCQFVPSSILAHGVDADQNGHVDLHGPADAVPSVARYLRHFGWRPGLDREQRVEVLLHYNRSRPYANTVLELARRLR
jgi:membrane-bound lytic murein transglycosylase B